MDLMAKEVARLLPYSSTAAVTWHQELGEREYYREVVGSNNLSSRVVKIPFQTGF